MEEETELELDFPNITYCIQTFLYLQNKIASADP